MRKQDFDEYKHWRMIINNCYPKNTTSVYEREGIKVHDTWLGDDGFWTFLEDLGTKPTPDHKLYRKDTSKDFTPDNCTWSLKPITRKDNIQITFDGVTQPLADWCRDLDIKYTTAYRRYKKDWTPEQILFKGYHNTITIIHEGVRYSFQEFCNKFNLKEHRTHWRFKAGWNINEIINEPSQIESATRKHMNSFYGDDEKKDKKIKLNKLRKTGRYKQYMKYLQNI